MSERVIAVLRIVLAVAAAGSVVVQVFAILMLWWQSPRDSDVGIGTDVAVTVIVVLGIATLQVVAYSIWRLLGMVRKHTVFSSAAFRHVDRVIAAIAAGALLLFALAIVLAPTDAAPGLVAMVCGAAVVTAGVALVVYVQRALLGQAVQRDAQARELETELGAVI